MFKYLPLLFLLFGTHVFAQNDSTCVEYSMLLCENGEYEKAVQLFIESDCITQQISDSLAVEQWMNLVQIFYKKDYDSLAIQMHLRALSLVHEFPAKSLPDSGDILTKIGKSYYFLDSPLCLDYYKKAVRYYESQDTLDLLKTGKLYLSRARAENFFDNPEAAINNANISLDYLLKNDNSENIDIAKAYTEIGQIQNYAGQPDKAISALLKAIEIFEHLEISYPRYLANTYTYLATSYLNKEDYEKAINFYQVALEMLVRSGFDSETLIYRKIINRLGNTYYLKSESERAIGYFEKYLALLLRDSIGNYQQIANTYSKIAASYTKLQQFQKADEYLDKAFRVRGFSIEKPHPFADQVNRTHLLMILYFKAKNYFKKYEVYGDADDLTHAFEWYDLCVRLIDEIIVSGSPDSARDVMYNFNYIFESMLDVCYHSYQLSGDPAFIDKALLYSEKSRNIVLRSSLQSRSEEVLAALPEDVLLQKQAFRDSLAVLQNTIYLYRNDNVKYIDLKARQSKLELEIADFEKMLKAKYPEYALLLEAIPAMSVEEVRTEVLRDHETLIHFFAGDDYIYQVVVNPQEAQFYKLPYGQLNEQLDRLRGAISAYPNDNSDTLLLSYQQEAFNIYTQLFKGLEPLLIERVLIVPDGRLEHIPVDALLTQLPVPGTALRSYPFMLKKYHIRYLHALSVAHFEASGKAEKQKVLAFAPTFSTENTPLDPLLFNQNEVKQIAQFLPLDKVLGKDAQLSVFKKRASDYEVLHLATHAVADDQEDFHSYIAFAPSADTTDSVLYTDEISLMQIPASLVVLSACETAVGPFRRGEGVISLERSFSNAGAQSVMTSLWSVSDRATSDIMPAFYAYLQAGMGKEEALHQAKLDYLNTQKAHPYYWASFILFGDPAPIHLHQSDNRLFLTLALLLVLITTIGIYARKNRQAQRRN